MTTAPNGRSPLAIKCSSTDCALGLHYFGPAFRRQSIYPVGEWRDCGGDLVDWTRVHQRITGDLDYTLSMLKRECWRHHWWHHPIDQKALNHARRKGRGKLAATAEAILSRALTQAPFRDGTQTRTSGNVVFYAQHATATCCRKCLEYWHGIPQSSALTAKQLGYATGLVMRYVEERLPTLTDLGERVPRSVRRTPARPQETEGPPEGRG